MSCGKQPLFPTTVTKSQVKRRMERWMGTSRSLCDNYIFRKYSHRYPGKPLKSGRKSPGKPWKKFHFTVGHPVIRYCSLFTEGLAPTLRLYYNVWAYPLFIRKYLSPNQFLFSPNPSLSNEWSRTKSSIRTKPSLI